MADFDIKLKGGLGIDGPQFEFEDAPKSKKDKKEKKSKKEDKEGAGYASAPASGLGSVGDYIHIRNQQRNGRKSTTSLAGLPEDFNLKKILGAFKKQLNCNGNIVDDELHGKIIQIQGDKRVDIQEFLVNELKIPKDRIKVHGS